MILFFDTETTGLTPGRIIQLSYIMDDGKSVRAKNFFCEVDYIEPGASMVTGFTVEILKRLANGQTFSWVADEVYDDFKSADLIVGHNVGFDIGFMIAEFGYLDRIFRYNESFDTMKAFTPILKLPRNSGGYKYPKLTELTEFLDVYPYDVNVNTDKFFNCGMLKSHDARYDTTALYLAFSEGIKRYDQLKEIYEKYI